MLYGRDILLGVFGIFLVSAVAVTAFGQTVPSEPEPALSNPAPSQSDTVTIIQEIHASETRIREEIHKIDKNMAVLKTRVNFIQWVVTIVGAPVFVYFVILGIQKWNSRSSKTELSPTSGRRVKESGGRDRFTGKMEPSSQFAEERP